MGTPEELHDREPAQSCKSCPCQTSSFHIFVIFFVSLAIVNQLEKYLMSEELNQKGPNAIECRQLNHALTVHHLESKEPSYSSVCFNWWLIHSICILLLSSSMV